MMERQERQGRRASQSCHAKRAGVSLLCSNIFTNTNEMLFQSNTSRSFLIVISIQQMRHPMAVKVVLVSHKLYILNCCLSVQN